MRKKCNPPVGVGRWLKLTSSWPLTKLTLPYLNSSVRAGYTQGPRKCLSTVERLNKPTQRSHSGSHLEGPVPLDGDRTYPRNIEKTLRGPTELNSPVEQSAGQDAEHPRAIGRGALICTRDQKRTTVTSVGSRAIQMRQGCFARRCQVWRCAGPPQRFLAFLLPSV